MKIEANLKLCDDKKQNDVAIKRLPHLGLPQMYDILDKIKEVANMHVCVVYCNNHYTRFPLLQNQIVGLFDRSGTGAFHEELSYTENLESLIKLQPGL